MRTFLHLLTLCSIAWSCINCNHYHTLPNLRGTSYGYWGSMEHCPNDMYATGMTIRYQLNRGSGKDNTALNAVKLFCNRWNAPCTQSNPISSRQEYQGDWQRLQWCPDGQVVIGFDFRETLHNAYGDNVAIVNFGAACGQPFGPRYATRWLRGDTDDWGYWLKERFCPDGYAACGIQTRISPFEAKAKDNFGLVNLHLDCCKVHDIPCTPSYQMQTLASFDNSIEFTGSIDHLANSINAEIGHVKENRVTAASLNSLLREAMSHESAVSYTVQIAKRKRATIRQLYLTCGSYRVALGKATEEGTKKPKPDRSEEEDDNSHGSDDDC